MQPYLTKVGFCRDCGKNIEHAHGYSLAFARLFDRLSMRVLTSTGIGSWHCRLCGRHSWYLTPPRRSAPNFVFDAPAESEGGFVEGGNYIRRDHSLVMRSERSSRYSAKFRQSVVNRVLSGQASLITIREELGVSEGDILSWIHDIVRLQEEQIEHLHQMVDRLVDRIPDSPRIESEHETLSD